MEAGNDIQAFSGLQAVISGKRLIFNKSGTHFDTVEMFHDSMDNPRIKRVMDILTEEKTIIFCRYESEIEQALQDHSGSGKI